MVFGVEEGILLVLLVGLARGVGVFGDLVLMFDDCRHFLKKALGRIVYLVVILRHIGGNLVQVLDEVLALVAGQVDLLGGPVAVLAEHDELPE